MPSNNSDRRVESVADGGWVCRYCGSRSADVAERARQEEAERLAHTEIRELGFLRYVAAALIAGGFTFFCWLESQGKHASLELDFIFCFVVAGLVFAAYQLKAPGFMQKGLARLGNGGT